MNLFGALIMAAAAVSGGERAGGHGVETVSAQVSAQIFRPAIVRQASGVEVDQDAPAPQISRRGPAILVEFQ